MASNMDSEIKGTVYSVMVIHYNKHHLLGTNKTTYQPSLQVGMC